MSFYDDDIKKKNRDQRKDFLRKHDRDIDDLRKIIKTPEGRRFVWKILSECSIYKASFTLNSMQTAFNEGRRDIGLALLADLNEADTFAYAKMQQEYVSELKSKQNEKKKNENEEEENA